MNLPTFKLIPSEYQTNKPDKWYLTDLFCPGCGKRTLFNEPAGNDYYAGTRYACPCGMDFWNNDWREDLTKEQYIENLKPVVRKSLAELLGELPFS